MHKYVRVYFKDPSKLYDYLIPGEDTPTKGDVIVTCRDLGTDRIVEGSNWQNKLGLATVEEVCIGKSMADKPYIYRISYYNLQALNSKILEEKAVK